MDIKIPTINNMVVSSETRRTHKALVEMIADVKAGQDQKVSLFMLQHHISVLETQKYNAKLLDLGTSVEQKAMVIKMAKQLKEHVLTHQHGALD